MKSERPAARAAGPSVRELIEEGAALFEASELSYGHGTSNAVDESAWLVMHAIGLAPFNLDEHLDRAIAPLLARQARALLAERVRTRKPAAYLIHEAWLGPHRFYVDERVIVPRSYIAELLRNWCQRPISPIRRPGKWVSDTSFSILDLCTGSGCLAILAALELPRARVDAADLSQDALDVARRNVEDYGLGERVTLVKSDLFSKLAGREYDLIISNPPYVTAASMKSLPEEFRNEPAMALASGADGLDHARIILAEARAHLKPGGMLMVEIGRNRKALERAYPKLPFQWPKTSGGRGFVFTLAREDLP